MTPKARAEVRFPLDDDAPDFDNVLRQRGYLTAIREEVEPLEAEVAKLRALGEAMNLAMFAYLGHQSPSNMTKCYDAMNAWNVFTAKEAGFTPTNTEDNG